MRHYLILVLAILCHLARADVVVQKYILGDMVYTYTNQYKNGGISGRIDVVNKKTGELRTRMSGLPPAGCDQSETEIPFGVVTTIDKTMSVVMCGSDDGKSTQVYSFDGNGHIRDVLFFGDSYANIEFDATLGMYYSVTAERKAGAFSSLIAMPIVYDWFGFHRPGSPIFNETSKSIYRKIYETEKQNLKIDQVPDESAIEALVSTQDPRYICSEYNQYVSKYVSRSVMREVIGFHTLNDIFPYFDISTCKEK